MIKPDLLLTWPRGYDYPLFRELLVKNRHRFGAVIIFFTTQADEGQDYLQFITDFLRNYDVNIIVGTLGYVGDWRNHAVNESLKISTNPWVLFWEQDFLVLEQRFWDNLLAIEGQFEMACYIERDRKHPACMLIKREVIEATSKDFSANPPSYDHFGKLTAEVTDAVGERETGLSGLGLVDGVDYRHMQGVTQNYHLVLIGTTIKYLFKGEEFIKYNYDSELAEVPQDPNWIEVMKKVDLVHENAWYLKGRK